MGPLEKIRDRRRGRQTWRDRTGWSGSTARSTPPPAPVPSPEPVVDLEMKQRAEDAVRNYVLGLARGYEGDPKIISQQPKVRNYAKLMGVNMDDLEF